MKFLVGFCILAVLSGTAFCEMHCNIPNPAITTEWIDLQGECVTAMRNQIQKEINASIQYLAMGSYFSRDTVNRPGFAELFFKAAKEERQHGSELIKYLSMRGQLTHDITHLIRVPTVGKYEWESGAEAIDDALKLETEVTKSIRQLIEICEKTPNFYHLVDYLTGTFLGEQLEGQRKLAGELSTLKKMESSPGGLGEFTYDKEL